MESMSEKIKLKEQLQGEFQSLIKKRLEIFKWYAHRLSDIYESIKSSENKISASVDATLLVNAINKLDDDFAKKEEEYFEEFRQLLKKYNRLQPADKKEELGMALARLKNKVNIAVAFVRGEARDILPQAKVLGVSGEPLVRLEYLSELALEKQMAEFLEFLDSE